MQKIRKREKLKNRREIKTIQLFTSHKMCQKGYSYSSWKSHQKKPHT